MTYATPETGQDPTINADGSDLESILTYRIFRLHAALDRQAMHILNTVSGLRQNEWKIISFLGLEKAHNSTDIARLTHIDPAIISRTLYSLEEDGLVVPECRGAGDSLEYPGQTRPRGRTTGI
jgi:hypothetical protein|tara:strand:+ start:516 stop:884 length:369 start_codon:yes stop_codon:yes gene_type:complete